MRSWGKKIGLGAGLVGLNGLIILAYHRFVGPAVAPLAPPAAAAAAAGSATSAASAGPTASAAPAASASPTASANASRQAASFEASRPVLAFVAQPVALTASRRLPPSEAQELLALLGSAPAPAPQVGPPLPGDDRFAKLSRPPQRRLLRRALQARQTPAGVLSALAVEPATAAAALHSLGEWIDFRKMRPGDLLTARCVDDGGLQELEISRGPIVQVRTRRTADGWHAERVEVVLDTILAEVSGLVRSSLWDALVGAGEDPRLVATLVDIFAYDIDFYNQVRPADSFFLLVEKRYVNGQFVEYGDVTAAEFVMAGRAHRAFLHRTPDGRVAYYDAAGQSMRKQLLKAPLKYALVTSRFGIRRHPVLGYTRSHNGTDYGVPVGTPVWAVGDGQVVRAGWHGGFGRLVEVAHPNGWVSQYAHLSRIHVRLGSRVTQKQTLGLVGQTGLATGPHLHYGLKRHGRYVNSLAQHFERSQPLRGPELVAFGELVAQLMENLGTLRLAQEATDSSASPG
jgi:murein DD-endopeptidase MepM/ murein hydrolase activator NlpD